MPSFDIIFDLDRVRLEASDAKLTPEQEQLIPLIDAQRDVTRLIDASGLGEFDVGKALYGLATAGFLHRIGKSRPQEDVVKEARVEEHRNLGIAFYRTGMFEEATREFRRVIDLRDSDVQARFYLGLVALRAGHFEEAVRLFQQATAQPGARAAVFHNLGYALERTGRFAEARAAYDEAVQRGGGDDARVQLSLGVLSLKVGDVEHADAVLSSSRALWGKRPPTAVWFHYTSLAAALGGDLDRALALVNEGLGVHPHSAALFNLLAVIHEKRGDLQAAVHAAERGLQEDRSLPQIHKNVGDCYYRGGKLDEAMEAYLRAVKLNPSLGDDVYFKLGNIRYKWQERDQAVACWERALELNPGNDRIRANLESVRHLRA